MKKTVITAVMAMLLSLPAVAATGKSVEPVEAPFARQIEFLLNQNEFGTEMLNVGAKVLFTFDQENRIRVLEVETADRGLESFVIEKLDGQKVYVGGQSLEGKRFVLPIRIAS